MELEEIKNSGILELYVLGDLSSKELAEVEQAISKYPALKQELFEIEKSFEVYAQLNAAKTDPTGRSMLVTAVNYAERLANGETATTPPPLSPNSKIVDFQEWLDREDLQEPVEYDSMHGHILHASPERKTLIVWLKEGAPPEIHTHEIEKFLIVEGTCDITIGDKTHSLTPGDFLEIPLFISHQVVVTSKSRCKLILERSAA